MSDRIDVVIDQVFRREGGRIRAALIGAVRDFELAEESVQDAFTRALETWPRDGVPDNPAGWITRVARNRALDRLRRRGRFRDRQAGLAHLAAMDAEAARSSSHAAAGGIGGAFDNAALDTTALHDDLLRLIFTCCHPALSPEAQVGLTLHTLCGLTTEEIARAFLVPKTTLQQRLVRAKRKIGRAGIPFRVPPANLLGERISAVRTTVYLIFNEGHGATAGDAATRAELCREAIRLGRLLMRLPAADAETAGLLALMLLTDARRPARVDAAGDPVLLADQDRTLWRQNDIAEGCALVKTALRQGRVGPYQIQAAIAAVHGEATRASDTDWLQIAGLYGVLVQVQPTPVVALNRAVAVAMANGPAAGLALIDALVAEGKLNTYHLLHSARADLLRRNNELDAAAQAYKQALGLATNDVDRRFLARRLSTLRSSGSD